MSTNPLIGKTITALYLADDQQAMRCDVGPEQIIARADGDCCSHTWIEHVEDPESIIGSEVLSASDISMSREEEEKDGDHIQFYGFKIQTVKGACVIDYRNSSNGYYGGSLEWDPEHFYGGVYGQNISTYQWKQIAGVVALAD